MTKKRGNGEGTIYKRKDGRWVGVVHLGWDGGKRRRKYVYGETRTQVADALTTTLRARQQGLPIPKERLTVGQFLDQYLADAQAPSVRPMTLKRDREIVHLHLQPELGRLRLSKLNAQHIQALLRHKQDEGLSARTVQMIHGGLRAALNQAVRWDLVPRNVALLVRPPRVEHREVQPLSPDEAAVFLAGAQGDRLEALYAVALALGLRQGEALGLRWGDVDLDAGILRVRSQLQRVDRRWEFVPPKSNRAHRTLNVPSEIIGALRRHRARQLEERLVAGGRWEEWDLVFATRHGKPLDGRNVTRSFQAIAQRAGLRPLRFHDLRHTAASFLLAQGVDARSVMEILGHSQIGLTLNTYAHVLPALKQDAADRMDTLFRTIAAPNR